MRREATILLSLKTAEESVTWASEQWDSRTQKRGRSGFYLESLHGTHTALSTHWLLTQGPWMSSGFPPTRTQLLCSFKPLSLWQCVTAPPGRNARIILLFHCSQSLYIQRHPQLLTHFPNPHLLTRILWVMGIACRLVTFSPFLFQTILLTSAKVIFLGYQHDQVTLLIN